MVSPTLRPKRSASAVIEPFEDEFLLYDPQLERVIELNPTAALVWQLCDGARTVEEIVTLIADAYPEEKSAVTADVHALLEKLADAGGVTMS